MIAMKSTANEPPSSTLHAPFHDESTRPDATLDDRAEQAASMSSTQLAVLSLPRLSVADGADAELAVEGVLGQGGMGVVQVARERALDREVAIKRLRPDVAVKSAAIASLLKEARLQGALEHPNVVPIHALGRDADDLPVLVMKRLSGVSWRDLIRDPRHPAWPADAGDRLTFHLETLMQLCNAVHFAHSRGVIHRDIKPDNVMIGQFGEVYLLDWGLSYCPRPGDEVDRTFVGSPAYLAPEMLVGTGPHLTPRTDVYLLGAALHEVLTGKVRHRGETISEVLYAAAESSPVDYPASAPGELAALCNRATHKDPAARPESALSFRQAVGEFLRHRGSFALAEAAMARLRELRARGGVELGARAIDSSLDLPIRTLFSQASFGFQQALSAWEGNTAAREGLTTTLTWMIQYELSRRNAEAAAALLAELPFAPPALASQIAELREQLAQEREALARLRDVEHTLDPMISFRPRIFVIVGLGVFFAGFLLVLSRVRPGGPSHQELIAAYCAILLALVVTLIVRRDVLLTTQFNRQTAAALLLIVAQSAANHGAALHLGISMDASLVADMIADAALSATVALYMPGIFWIVPAVFLAGALVAVRWPHLALATAVTVGLVNAVSSGALASRWFRELSRSPSR
jgi:tRNA A-37 threonylcarbamoyl transferase component Bud32